MLKHKLVIDLGHKLLIACFIFSFQKTLLFAAPLRNNSADVPIISGTWKGTLTQPGSSFSFSLYLTQDGSSVAGTSTISTGDAYATMSLSGAISGTVVNLQETTIIASSGPPGPSSYWCIKTLELNHQGATVELLEGNWHQFGCNAGQVTLEKESSWGDLDQLANDYQRKIGTRNEWYSRFWLCLNRNACEEYQRTGEQGIAGGFNKYVFDYMQAHSRRSALNYNCYYMFFIPPNDIIKLECMLRAGAYHFAAELTPAFFSYGKYISPSESANWDQKHDLFVNAKNLPCFDVVLENAFSSPLYPANTRDAIITMLKQQTLATAQQLREFVQWYYGSGNVTSQVSANDSLKIDNSISLTTTYPLSLTKDALFSNEVENVLPLKVSAGDQFFLNVSESYQLNVALNNSHASVAESSTGLILKYTLIADESVASISETGLLTIRSTSAPFINSTPLIYVIVEEGNNIGIGQFAIKDFDVDNDLLADSYEVAYGLRCPITLLYEMAKQKRRER